jgi:hypothetical protein
MYFHLHTLGRQKGSRVTSACKNSSPRARDVVIGPFCATLSLSHLSAFGITPASACFVYANPRHKVWSARDNSFIYRRSPLLRVWVCVYNIHLLSVDVKYEMIKLDRRSVTRSINFGRKVGDNVEHLKRTTPFLIFIGSKNLVGTCDKAPVRMNEKHTPGNLRMRAANVYANLPFPMTHRRTNIKRYIFVPCCLKWCLGCQYRIIGPKIIFFIFPYAFHHF